MIQRHDLDTFECDQPTFVFQQDGAPHTLTVGLFVRYRKQLFLYLNILGILPTQTQLKVSGCLSILQLRKIGGPLHTLEWTGRT